MAISNCVLLTGRGGGGCTWLWSQPYQPASTRGLKCAPLLYRFGLKKCLNAYFYKVWKLLVKWKEHRLEVSCIGFPWMIWGLRLMIPTSLIGKDEVKIRPDVFSMIFLFCALPVHCGGEGVIIRGLKTGCLSMILT